jgi:amidase
MNEELCFMTAADLAMAIRTRRLSPVEVIDAVLAQIDRINPAVNAIVTVTAEEARAAARAAESAVMEGKPLGALHGVPVSVKDLTFTKGIRTTLGSLAYADHVPTEDALIVERLHRAGAILIGKTNTPELGAGANTKNRVFGPTRNPWKLTHTCGGSSGGAAVALATGMGPIAEGSDLGGSLRIPASFCGVVGFRTSPGVVPAYPTQLAWDPLAINGPMARTVLDTALMLSVIAGPDARAPMSIPVDAERWVEAAQAPEVVSDATSATRPHRRPDSRPDKGEWRAAWSPDLGLTLVDREVAQTAGEAARAFEDMGCAVEEEHPDFSDIRGIIHGTRGTRMAALHADLLPKWREKMNPDLVWNIEQGLGLTARQWGEAEVARTALWHRVRKFFETYDFLLTPTVAVPPFPLETDYPKEINGRQVETYVDWFLLTYAVTLTGLPAISVPAGWTASGLPVGLQIVGPWRGETEVLRAAAAFEVVRPWSDQWPSIATDRP